MLDFKSMRSRSYRTFPVRRQLLWLKFFKAFLSWEENVKGYLKQKKKGTHLASTNQRVWH